MAYAVDFLIAFICTIVAVLQIMQIKTTRVFQRTLGPDGRPMTADALDAAELSDPDSELELEVFMTKSASPHCAPPREEGWERGDDRRPTARCYVDAGFGVALAAAAIGLVLGGSVPTAPIAWILFATVAVQFAVDLPRLFRLLFNGQFGALVFIPQILMAVGLLAATRLL